MNISIIVEDNPISRAYIYYFYLNRLKFNKIYLLNGPKFPLINNKLKSLMNFKKNNFHAINFLKNHNIHDLLRQIEDHFSLDYNFILKMFEYENLQKVGGNLVYINSFDVNNSNLIKYILKEDKDCFILNTGKQILNKILSTNYKFLHIHPGYLPYVKGADSSIHMIDKFNQLGVSSFLINRKIDEGEIILRNKLKLPKFKFNDLKRYSIKDQYRIWFSFIDPAIRVSQLSSLLILLDSKKIKFIECAKEDSKYYSFAEDKLLSRVFGRVFI